MDLASLLEVQRLDIAIEQTRHARRSLPAVLAHDAAAADVASARAEIASRRDRQAVGQRELDTVERESAELDAQRARLDKQMKTIISPREAEALQHEIQGLVDRRNVLDDRGLELLEESAALDAEIASLTDRERAAADTEATALADRRVAEADADRHLAELENDRATRAAALAPADLATYERLRAQLGGIAVVTIERGTCTGCHMGVSVSEIDAMKRLPADTAAECPNCARLVVR